MRLSWNVTAWPADAVLATRRPQRLPVFDLATVPETGCAAVGTGGALVENGGDNWFFLTVDYAFGFALEADTAKYVKSKGGQVVGSVRHPLNSPDFSSFGYSGSRAVPSSPEPANSGLGGDAGVLRPSSPSLIGTGRHRTPARAAC